MLVTTLTSILTIVSPYARYILFGGLALGFIFYFNHKVNEKADKIIQDFKEEQQRVIEDVRDRNKKLETLFTTRVDELEKSIQESKEETNALTEEFKNLTGSGDSSGIHGKFLRD
jgi:peptidoglycan hydrolase CwlO-like protein